MIGLFKCPLPWHPQKEEERNVSEEEELMDELTDLEDEGEAGALAAGRRLQRSRCGRPAKQDGPFSLILAPRAAGDGAASDAGSGHGPEAGSHAGPRALDDIEAPPAAANPSSGGSRPRAAVSSATTTTSCTATPGSATTGTWPCSTTTRSTSAASTASTAPPAMRVWRFARRGAPGSPGAGSRPASAASAGG
ncbi:unnamed protein product [Prorocentrum cordatum]|uniref:Uncharacterized protein n=1 Tax=Prorocentrum cordatum TaxID=2364126 RepID=A0ABN9Y412_9DINO|nr:unnamed protein product [Polarella glacialis]